MSLTSVAAAEPDDGRDALPPRRAPGWFLAAPIRFSLVCFRREGSDEENAAILERVNATGEAFLSNSELGGRYVLRLAIGNHGTTEDDVRRAWVLLQEP